MSPKRGHGSGRVVADAISAFLLAVMCAVVAMCAAADSPHDVGEWLTLKECAERLKVPYSRVRRWTYLGILPSHVLPGGRGRRVRAGDLEAAMGEPAAPKDYVH